MSEHEPHMRRCFELALNAAGKGNHPFGALLVRGGEAVLEAENTVNTERDSTRHAELNLVVEAERRFTREELGESTLYASTAPCLMCGAAIYASGIRRVVYGVTYERFASLIPGGYRYVPIEKVYELHGADAEVIGGVLEDEGVRVYDGWLR
ncbi:nucleoside deaminase [Candidatus Bathyarchaeota archaeon]|nr:nucleoside deaminase [Candidatus Bathyarchaeota archaeon]